MLLAPISFNKVVPSGGEPDYAYGGNEPDLIFHPKEGTWQTLGTSRSDPLDVLTAIDVPDIATMTDSSGNVVWNAHNLAINSATPATQSITVVSGADYTVELTGTGSITLSGAGTGTVTSGSPVEITASTTSLTLTVSGTVDTMWAYRSDLGGMANAPGTSSTYVATSGTPVYLPRINHHKYIDSTWTNVGCLFDPQGATQLFENTDGGLSTQGVTVTAQAYTVHFTGTGTITFSGAHTGSLVGTGTGEENRVSTTFTPSAGTVTCTVSGTVTDAQFEAGDYRTAYIPNTGTGTVARLAEELGIANADLDLATDAISLVMHLYASYSDNNDSTEIGLWSINKDNNERHQTYIGTDSTRTGRVTSQYRHNNAINAYTANNTYSPGYHVAMNTAVRHDLNGSTGTSQVAADGTAGTAATGTANDIEDTADLVFGEINGTVPSEQGEMVISLVTMFDVDIGEAGIEFCSDPTSYPA